MIDEQAVALAPPAEASSGLTRIMRQVEGIPPADAAIYISGLAPDEAASVMEHLGPHVAARIAAKMHPGAAAIIACAMRSPLGATMLEHVAPDDRVDILAHIPEEIHDEIVGEMRRERADEVHQLEQYAPDTAGGIMTTQVTALYEYVSTDNAITTLRRLGKTIEQLFYIYVIDRRQHLVGVLSVRDLILADADTILHDIMTRDVQSVSTTMKQQDVATLLRKHGFVAIPVVDADARLVGMVTLDDVVELYEEQATEEVQKMFGAGAEERLTSAWQLSLRKRFWWLEINLATAFVGAGIVSVFTSTISALPILAAYLTIVSSMGANAGAQAMAVAIRGIATNECRSKVLRQVLKREFMVGLISGIAIGLTTSVIIMVFNYSDKSLLIGTVVCVALVINHVNACVTGVFVPFLMKRLGFDPAQSASIIATTFTDCIGFIACLGMARLALHLLNVPV